MDAAKRDHTELDADASAVEEGTSPKRARTEQVANSGTKDAEFWFSDGTVILLAQDVQFKIYKGWLAEHSPMFRDMFSLPQPTDRPSTSDAATSGDPCPVVPLSDSAQDLRHVLRMYMPTRGSNLYAAKSPTFHAISACIRFGHKYQMADLYEQSIKYLKDFYTDDFDRWAAHAGVYTPPGFSTKHVIGVVNLARFVDEPSILPTALYACTRLEDALFDGLTREDGSQEMLTTSDLRLCFAAKDRIAEAALRARLRAFSTPPTSCGMRNCLSALMHGKAQVEDKKLRTVIHQDLTAPAESIIPLTGLCVPCLKVFRERDLAERKKAWNSLPEIMGVTVPGWGGVAAQGK